MERSRSFNFIPSPSIDLLDQPKVVLAHNIGHVSDKSLHVYHLDRHEVLFYKMMIMMLFKFYFIIKSLFSIRFFQKHHVLAVDYSSDIIAASSKFRY